MVYFSTALLTKFEIFRKYIWLQILQESRWVCSLLTAGNPILLFSGSHDHIAQQVFQVRHLLRRSTTELVLKLWDPNVCPFYWLHLNMEYFRKIYSIKNVILKPLVHIILWHWIETSNINFQKKKSSNFGSFFQINY